MSSAPVLLIFGSGANTGLATVKKFASEGYKIAAVSRNPSAELKETAHLILPADLSNPHEVESVFAKVTGELGTPHVVVYNAYDAHFVRSDNPIQVPVDQLISTLNVNTVSAYAAAAQAIKGFSKLPESASKTYLYTGNMQNTLLYPSSHTLGMGKNATAYWIETAVSVYQGKYKLYYVDERAADGESVMQAIDGPAHAEEFWRLSQMKEQSHWCWTFVKGQGYVRNKAAVDRERRDFDLPGIPDGGLSIPELYAHMAQLKK